MSLKPADVLAEDPNAQLERALIEEFLALRGHTASSLEQLPAAEADALLKEACLYASGRLTEVESRAHYVHDVQRGPQEPAAGRPSQSSK